MANVKGNYFNLTRTRETVQVENVLNMQQTQTKFKINTIKLIHFKLIADHLVMRFPMVML